MEFIRCPYCHHHGFGNNRLHRYNLSGVAPQEVSHTTPRYYCSECHLSGPMYVLEWLSYLYEKELNDEKS